MGAGQLIVLSTDAVPTSRDADPDSGARAVGTFAFIFVKMFLFFGDIFAVDIEMDVAKSGPALGAILNRS